jgi:hypothetical protein
MHIIKVASIGVAYLAMVQAKDVQCTFQISVFTDGIGTLTCTDLTGAGCPAAFKAVQVSRCQSSLNAEGIDFVICPTATDAGGVVEALERAKLTCA